MADTIVGDGQTSIGAVLGAGDRQVVESETFNAATGGRAFTTTIQNGGQQFLMYGSATGATVNVGGAQYVYGTGTATATTLNGGEQVVSGSYDRYGAEQTDPHYTYGRATGTIVNGGGVQRVESYASDTIVNSGGIQFVSLSGNAAFDPTAVTNTTINAGGSQFLYGGSASGTRLNMGGSILLGQRDYTTQATASFDRATNVLTVSDGAGRYVIPLAGDYSTTAFLLSENGSYSTFSDLIRVTAAPLCFCAGVRLETPGGAVAVEALRVGDELLTYGGRRRPIRWIGTTRALASGRNRPVIVRAGALAPGQPARDIRVSGGHGFLFGDVLIPIDALVNGSTILHDQEPRTLLLFHVELDVHDIISSDGAAAESYRDDGNRRGFTATSGSGAAARTLPTCVPVVGRGPLVERTRARLAARAEAIAPREARRDAA